ncbi:MAG: hypothetical protein KKG47_17410 [Proteobacteria bacterium]|nr:hypothetical protein [Pseudomonadota bacterium]
MHVVVSWDIEAEGDQWDQLNGEMKKCLSGYSWVKPLTTFYIVQVSGNQGRTRLKDALVAVCQEHPKLIHFVISPAMRGGLYSGWLPKSLWPTIRQRTREATNE